MAFDKAEIAWKLIVQDHGKSASDSIGEDSSLLAKVAASQMGRMHSEADPETCASKMNVFSFEDGRWVVRFREQTIYPQDITGIKYLHFLISNPGHAFSPRELYDGFGGRKTRKKPNSMSAGEALRSGVTFDLAKPDVHVDQQGKNEMLARLEDIETEMVAAKLVPDADLIEKLAAERIAITEHLRKAFTPVGSRRIQEPDLVRRMKAVDIAIRRAKEKIQRAGHHELLQHLNKAVEVKVKFGCSYSAGDESPWRTQPLNFSAPIKPR